MKNKKCVCILVTLLFIATLCGKTYAMTPPDSSDSFDSIKDMLTSLKEYIDTFQNLKSYRINNPAPGSSLKKRQVIYPVVKGFSLVSCHYADGRYGGGTDYFFFEFEGKSERENIRVIVYYFYKNVGAKQLRDFMGEHYAAEGSKMTESTGTYNGIPYNACTYTSDDGSAYCRYNLKIGDLLVNVIDSEPFSKSRIGLIQFKKTNLKLPVYMLNETPYRN